MQDMSRISTIIDLASEGSRPLADLLRQVKIVAARTGAAELGEWAHRELNGYGPQDPLPSFRGPHQAPVIGTWSGPMGSSSRGMLSRVGLRQDFVDTWFAMSLRQPVAELEALMAGGDDPAIGWDPYAVLQYDQWANSGEGGATWEFMTLVGAKTVAPRQMIAGVLDAIRNQVLDLALALEAVSPTVGEPGGPTMADRGVAAAT